MKDKITLEKVIFFFFQCVAALILFKAGASKVMGEELSVYIFDALGMSESLMIIGVIELLAGVLLAFTASSHYGAILGLLTMIGAVIAHVSKLGLEVQGDGGQLVGMMLVVIVSCLVVMWIKRRDLPLVGHTIK